MFFSSTLIGSSPTLKPRIGERQVPPGLQRCIEEDEGRLIAAVPKRALDALTWEPRANHAGHSFCHSVIVDRNGVTIPGLTVVLEARTPLLVQSCLYLFTLYKVMGGQKRRAYQLEVVPRERRSHNGLHGPLYGPHEHFGEAAYTVTDPLVTCSSWPTCLAYFLRQANLEPLNVASPC